MNNIVFVILHYENISDTTQCLNSLMPYLNGRGVSVVIVDNGSTYGTLDDLKSTFKDKNSLYFLRSETNEGFARGNNIGYKYAKRYLNPSIIILANSDIVFPKDNFISKLIQDYLDSHFTIAGPKIISAIDGKNQNPVKRMYGSKKDVINRIHKFKILLLLSYFNMDTIARSIFSRSAHNELVHDNDFQLHGACLIFGKEYIRRYEGLYDKTFMYGEESILKFISERDHLNMTYLSNIVVIHKEGTSTTKVLGKGVRKRRFFYRENIKGCQLLKELMTR